MAPSTQTRVVVTAFNPADPTSTLRVDTDAPVPKPKEGEVLMRVTARPINPADVFSIMGVYPGFAPPSLPATPGLEGAGVVEDANGTALAAGTRGFIFFDTKNGNGSWQEYVAVPASSVIPVPDSVSDEAAAQLLVNPVTVVGMLDELAAPPGEYVLQSAAGSTLGRQLIALAKKRGVKTINIVRRAEQAAELGELGADEVLCSETDDIAARVKEITGGKGAWGAVDAVGGPLTARMTGALRNGGTILIYGAMSGLEFTGSIVDCLFRDVTVKGFWLNVYLGRLSDEAKAAVFASVVSWLADGSLAPYNGAKFALKDVAVAVKASQVTARAGKVLLA